MACPLCGGDEKSVSPIGTTAYQGEQFHFVRCRSCRSHYCDPMPGAATLAQMYGPQYLTAFDSNQNGLVDDPKQVTRTIDVLRTLGGGTLLDYGCGTGRVLREAAKLAGWLAVGLEFDEAVARETERQTGLRIVHDPSDLQREGIAPVDVLHLGDVIEHLTDLDHQMPEILGLLKPGGVILAQGPLEGNDRVLLGLIKLARLLGRGGAREGAPYHVMLATAQGQLEFFHRFGLEDIEYVVSEVDWPCPSQIKLGDLKRPRVLTLFAARKLSRLVGRFSPSNSGNRYYYAGRLPIQVDIPRVPEVA